ncbi:Uncharacterised protein [Chlamydia trachomatis]|nr:Uncharacterised protein [Chlamydia trachomatis]
MLLFTKLLIKTSFMKASHAHIHIFKMHEVIVFQRLICIHNPIKGDVTIERCPQRKGALYAHEIVALAKQLQIFDTRTF